MYSCTRSYPFIRRHWQGENNFKISIKHNETSWWFQPIWKICSSNRIISPIFGVKIKKHLKPPPRKQWSTISGWCLTPTLLLICSSFSRGYYHPLLICSSLSTCQISNLKAYYNFHSWFFFNHSCEMRTWNHPTYWYMPWAPKTHGKIKVLTT